MDSAGIAELFQEVAQLRSALAAQGATVGRHELLIGQLRETVHAQGLALQECQAQLARQPAPLAATSTPVPLASAPGQREPRLPAPERYDGNPGGCRGFLVQVDLTFRLQPLAFPTDEARIAYVITLLTHRALAWATAVWEEQTRACQHYTWFVAELRRVFDHPIGGREAASRLLRMRQGTRSAADYAVEFRTLAAESHWDEEALLATFLHGLTEVLKDDLAAREPTRDLEGLIDATIRADNRHRERQRDRRSVPYGTPEPRTRPFGGETPAALSGAATVSRDEPMQLGSTHLSPEERERRMRERRCLYCGLEGHFRTTCPELGKAHVPTHRGGR